MSIENDLTELFSKARYLAIANSKRLMELTVDELNCEEKEAEYYKY
jgi:hypothetical protein